MPTRQRPHNLSRRISVFHYVCCRATSILPWPWFSRPPCIRRRARSTVRASLRTAKMSPFTIVDRIVTGHQQYYATQYVHISSFTFLLWDYIITLSDEVELFWGGRWSYPRVLFFVNRYQAIGWQVVHTMGVFIPSSLPNQLYVLYPDRTVSIELIKLMSGAPSCQVWIHNLIALSSLSLIIPVHLILSFRVYGLYNCANWIASFLAVLLLGSTAAELYVSIDLSPTAMQIVLPVSDITVCEANRNTVSHLYFGLIPALIFDTSALLLVLFRGVSYVKTQKITGYKGSNLLRVFIRDSILFFLVIFVVYLALTIAIIKLPASLHHSET
ncbi:hypothetical protein AB1N83_003530 [Pleurotus pulmonarius]